MKKAFALAGVTAALLAGSARPAAATHVLVVGADAVNVIVVNDCTGETEQFIGTFAHVRDGSLADAAGGEHFAVHGFGVIAGTHEPHFTGRFTSQQTVVNVGEASLLTTVTHAVLSEPSGQRLVLHVVSHLTAARERLVGETVRSETTCVGALV